MSSPSLGQLKFPIERKRFPDRNLHQGGRSFYFFDFDDNVAFLETPIYIFEAQTGNEVPLSTGHFARIAHLIGQPGPYLKYTIDPDESRGSFRRFRDEDDTPSHEQPFIKDIQDALKKIDVAWKGPAWDVFEHAVHNARPVSIITARGHAPKTLEEGIRELYRAGHLSRAPNYLDIFPVSFPPVVEALGGHSQLSIADLKKMAIHRSVHQAFEQYGENPHHRFGMSDDAKDNVALAVEAMAELKQVYTQNSFFVFDTSEPPTKRIEITLDGQHAETIRSEDQLSLFSTSDDT